MIEKGSQVKMDYTLKVDGQVFDFSEGKQPFEYTHGEGKIIPGLASRLEGLKEGEEKTISVPPEEAYGAVNEQAFRDVPKTAFPDNIDPKEGMVLQVGGGEDKNIPAVVEQVKAESVRLNFNHPLAGKTLVFDVKILNVQ